VRGNRTPPREINNWRRGGPPDSRGRSPMRDNSGPASRVRSPLGPVSRDRSPVRGRTPPRVRSPGRGRSPVRSRVGSPGPGRPRSPLGPPRRFSPRRGPPSPRRDDERDIGRYVCSCLARDFCISLPSFEVVVSLVETTLSVWRRKMCVIAA
jgi:hypothetical protein